jgi:hypothetical protein
MERNVRNLTAILCGCFTGAPLVDQVTCARPWMDGSLQHKTFFFSELCLQDEYACIELLAFRVSDLSYCAHCACRSRRLLIRAQD